MPLRPEIIMMVKSCHSNKKMTNAGSRLLPVHYFFCARFARQKWLSVRKRVQKLPPTTPRRRGTCSSNVRATMISTSTVHVGDR
jgi:hypothetical protein